LDSLLILKSPNSFYFAYNLAFVATLLCAYATQRNYQKISQVLFKNKQLVQVAEQHTQWTEELCVQFQQEVNKSKDIEAQLQFNNHLFEQKFGNGHMISLK
jgi:hypothetical protein